MSASGSAALNPISSLSKKYGNIYVLLLVIALFGMIQIGVVRFLHENDFLANQPSWILVVELFAGLSASIAVHEAGHAIAGTLVGMRVLSLSVWPLRVIHTRRGWSFKVSFSPQAPLGQGAMIPSSLTNLRHRFLIHNIGGPLVGMLTSIAAAWWLIAHQAHINSTLAAFLCRYVTFGLWLNVVSSIPGIPMTDATSIKLLLDKGPVGEKFAAYFASAAQIAYGMHCDEMDALLLEKISQPTLIGLFERYSLFHAYYWTLSNGEPAKAKVLLDRYLQLTTQPEYSDVKPLISLEKVYFDGRYSHNADSERGSTEQLRAIPPATTVAPFIATALKFRAESALQLGLHRLIEANVAAEQGLELASNLEADDSNLSRIILHDLRELRDLSTLHVAE